ncbi:MAG: hypothetical protein NPIRA06_30240 [Nitrospirales bacterium]|nr:MAG: hypothetical protein NPIRA06_30240 [Nitrospirales bacterium]
MGSQPTADVTDELSPTAKKLMQSSQEEPTETALMVIFHHCLKGGVQIFLISLFWRSQNRGNFE